MEESNRIVIIVGGGLVGALNACYFAKRNFIVHVFESRPDPRNEKHVQGRSINLALSFRGRQALKRVGLEDVVVSRGKPMYARMIHDMCGGHHPFPYGIHGQHLSAVERRRLNEVMINEAEKTANVHFHFSHKLVHCDADSGTCVFENKGKTTEFKATLIVGCDGAYSAIRKELARKCLFQYSQEYIEHGYIELVFPPNEQGNFCMAPDCLHIWPRNDFMMIALPNLDFSFTGTLFMKYSLFDSIQSPEDLLKFFQKYYPDALPLIGREALIETFFNNKPGSLISIKCKPYHYSDKLVIMGDAAHAMVPFYGQGMNSGFEDCLIFDDLMTQFNEDLAQVLPEFSRVRCKDGHVINDLAMKNYIEMRHSVNTISYKLRRKIDVSLHKLFPRWWIPLYTMVSFTRIPYSECLANRKWQNKMLIYFLVTSSLGLAAVTAYHVKENFTTLLSCFQRGVDILMQRLKITNFQ